MALLDKKTTEEGALPDHLAQPSPEQQVIEQEPQKPSPEKQESREQEPAISESDTPAQESDVPAAPGPASSSPAQQTGHSEKSAQQVRIEGILQEDLKDLYLGMDEQHRAMFKAAGEENTRKIDALLGETKVQVKKVFEIIKSWLRMIPGVNKWFIIQEAKIKTDKLVHMKDEEKKL